MIFHSVPQCLRCINNPFFSVWVVCLKTNLVNHQNDGKQKKKIQNRVDSCRLTFHALIIQLAAVEQQLSPTQDIQKFKNKSTLNNPSSLRSSESGLMGKMKSRSLFIDDSRLTDWAVDVKWNVSGNSSRWEKCECADAEMSRKKHVAMMITWERESESNYNRPSIDTTRMFHDKEINSFMFPLDGDLLWLLHSLID